MTTADLLNHTSSLLRAIDALWASWWAAQAQAAGVPLLRTQPAIAALASDDDARALCAHLGTLPGIAAHVFLSSGAHCVSIEEVHGV